MKQPQQDHSGHEHGGSVAGSGAHAQHDKHAGPSVAMFRNKFWVSLILTRSCSCLVAGVLASAGIVLAPAVSAVLMSASTVIVAINAQLLRGARV